jgi:hypothetical protein
MPAAAVCCLTELGRTTYFLGVVVLTCSTNITSGTAAPGDNPAAMGGGGQRTLKAKRSPEGLKMVMAAGSCLFS